MYLQNRSELLLAIPLQILLHDIGTKCIGFLEYNAKRCGKRIFVTLSRSLKCHIEFPPMYVRGCSISGPSSFVCMLRIEL